MDIKRVTANDLTTAPTDMTGYTLLPANTPVDGAGLALPTANPQWERAPERIVQLAHYLSASPHQRGHLNLTPLRILWLETRAGIFQVHLSEPKPAKGTWVMTTDGHRRAPAGLYELLKESFESLLLTPSSIPHRP